MHNPKLPNIQTVLLPTVKAQIDKNTWEMVIPPEGVNIVGSKWTYYLKKNNKNTIIRLKSCLVAQGFTQTFGVNYDETYIPVVRMTSLWTICTIAAYNNWPIHQMGVDVAYLNATLENPIYMQKPPGYYKDKTEHVLLLKKCLSKALFNMGFKKSSMDASVFYQPSKNNFAIIGAAVDDLTITATNEEIIHGVKQDLEQVFKMKDLGEIH